jgi:hypothetical protein
VSSPAESESRVRDILARANLPDDQIAHQLSAVRPRLGTDGRYRRSTGAIIAVEDVASLLLASERAKHAPRSTAPPKVDLVALRRDLIALRAREAQAPRSITDVLNRLVSPLDTIRP